MGGSSSNKNRSTSDNVSSSQASNWSNSSQTSESSSRPLTADELGTYWDKLNAMSGGRSGAWATQGTAPVAATAVQYQGVSDAQLRNLGGAGASRLLAARQVYGDRGAQLAADPSMTLAQRMFAGGTNTRELYQSEDAVAKENEAALTQLAALQAQAKYAADVRNADTAYAAAVRNSDTARLDATTLADILARFKGDISSSRSSSQSSGGGQSSEYSRGHSASSGKGSSWSLSNPFAAIKF